MVTAALLLIAAFGHGADHAARPWWVAAFVGCLVGDVLLMLPRDLFVPGLVAFLLGHLAFVVGLLRLGGHHRSGVLVALAVALVLVGFGVLAPRVVDAVRRDDPPLVAPVLVYVLAISAMVLVAGWRGGGWGLLGGALFYVSDSALAWDRFVNRSHRLRVLVMVTYHGALTGLLVALFR